VEEKAARHRVHHSMRQPRWELSSRDNCDLAREMFHPVVILAWDGEPFVWLTDLTLSCAAGSARRSQSGAAVAANDVAAPSGDLQPP
jgi:hypothetical protein